EDGIRDKLVTGVQTCALPISPADQLRQRRCGAEAAGRRRFPGDLAAQLPAAAGDGDHQLLSRRPVLRRGDHLVPRRSEPRDPGRSEERRVGKGWTAWWMAEQ